jgi:hypothetical protein
MNEINKQTIDLLLSYENINTSRLLLKRSLKHFIAVFHFYLTGKQFIFKKFHKEIIKELELVVFGEAEKKNLIINIVPRFGKSAIAQYFTAWSFALNLSSNFIYTSYSDNLVLSFSDKIKDIIESDKKFQTPFKVQKKIAEHVEQKNINNKQNELLLFKQ